MSITSFSLYDSSKFADITESITDSKTNPFLFDNSSNIINTFIEDELTTVHEPINVFTQYRYIFEGLLINRNILDDEFYLPELTSYRMYGSHDFWYLFLVWNNIPSANEYNRRTIKVLPLDDLPKIESLLNIVTNKISDYTPNKYTIFK
jgi:hypothetical protein